jgi:hypothetical protein
MTRRKTDYGTIILHWVLVAAFGVALFSGLRIATEMPDQGWIALLDPVLPLARVWVSHMQAAIVLVAVSLAYTIYMIRSGLSRRVALDRSRLQGLLGRRQARSGTVSVMLTWGFFAAMLALMTSGSALYFGIFAGYIAVMVHWYATWLTLAFTGLHILLHYRLGGFSQLLRIFRPQGLPAPPAKLDAVELLTLLVAQSERLAPEAETESEAASQPSLQPAQPSGPISFGRTESRHAVARPAARRAGQRRIAHPQNSTLQSNPFVVAAAMAITCVSVITASDWLRVDSLKVHRIAVADAPILDGDTSDRVWRSIEPYSVMTNAGGNFDGKGETRVDIRAAHDGTWAYFLFTWEDPTRSLKQLPLIKQSDGWHLLHKGFETGDEHEFNEDKFSVLLTTSNVTLAGDRTFHPGVHPIADAPASPAGRGLHFTTDGGYADVWEWKATSSGATGWMDDAHFGPPLDPTPTQRANLSPYPGGFAADPGRANYSDNFVVDANSAGGVVRPLRLPTDLAATATAMGATAAPDPDLGESEGARWFMMAAESAPYSVDRDQSIPPGTVLPGVIIDGEFSGDRADVRCAARWASGHWALEVARRLDTRSRYDVPLQTGVFMRVAAFDHSQIRHTRHVRPIRLEVE